MCDINELKANILKNISHPINVDIITNNKHISITIDYNTMPDADYLSLKQHINKYGYDYQPKENEQVSRSITYYNMKFQGGSPYSTEEEVYLGVNDILVNIENELNDTKFNQIQINVIKPDKHINFMVIIMEKMSFCQRILYGYSTTFKYLSCENPFPIIKS